MVGISREWMENSINGTYPSIGMCFRGVFESLELAEKTLQEYPSNIYEYYYSYVVIEEVRLNCVDSCVFPNGENWYKWNREEQCYQKIKKPDHLKHIFSFT